MKGVIEVAGTSIHCDECGYEREVKKTDIRESIGCKCPKCNAIMLTEEDVALFEKIEDARSKINEILGGLTQEEQASAYRTIMTVRKKDGQYGIEFPKVGE